MIRDETSSDRAAAQIAETLRLSLVEGLSIRAIAKKIHLSRRRIRKILGRALTAKDKARSASPPAAPRSSILDPYLSTIRKLDRILVLENGRVLSLC